MSSPGLAPRAGGAGPRAGRTAGATWWRSRGRLNLSNLDKVLWPATGTTKGDMVNYYAQIAPVLVPHLVGRAVTLKRFPDGVERARSTRRTAHLTSRRGSGR